LSYVFGDAARDRERARLQSLEAIFDPATRRRLTEAGLARGANCLEVGAGAGSILAWMADVAGPTARVTAVDLNTGFLSSSPANVTVMEGDIRTLPLEPASFDVVHARYVLVHIPAAARVVERLWSLLRPGGALLLEEPDFTVARAWGPASAENTAFTRVHRAIVRMYETKGSDPAFGTHLPSLLQSLGAQDLRVENDAPAVPGGSPIPRMMRSSAETLADKYVATGEVDDVGLKTYTDFTQNPARWAIYYATVAASARK
jgi:SAM-dependent methyltransferase